VGLDQHFVEPLLYYRRGRDRQNFSLAPLMHKIGLRIGREFGRECWFRGEISPWV
jgi:hypothetical protein